MQEHEPMKADLLMREILLLGGGVAGLVAFVIAVVAVVTSAAIQ